MTRNHVVLLALGGLGGSTVVATELGEGLHGRGWAVDGVCMRPPWFATAIQKLEGSAIRGEVNWHWPTKHKFNVFSNDDVNMGRVAELLAKTASETSVIHTHYAGLAPISLLARRLCGSRLVTTLHGTDVTHPSLPDIERVLLDLSRGVSAVSTGLADKARARWDNEVQVIPNWPRVADQRVRVGEDDEILLIHVSNFRGVKRSETCVTALKVARERGANAKLLLVGKGDDLAALLQFAEESGVREHVRPLGVRDDAPNLISGSDIVLISSSEEACPLVALEAAANGIPVVGYRILGLTQTLGESAFLVEDGSTSRFAAAVADLSLSAEARSSAAQQQGSVVAEHFSRERSLDLYESLLTTALQ